MVWLFKIVVQINVCNSSNPKSFRGAGSWAPYQGSALDPLGTWSPDPSPTYVPITTNPGSAPDIACLID